jgi:hypothetical protein
MTTYSAARLSTAAAVGLLLASAMLQVGYYGSVNAHVTDDFQPVVSAIWLACAINLAIVAAVVLAVRSLESANARRVLIITGLNPLSIAVLQIVYHASWPPPLALLLAALAIFLAARFAGAQPHVPEP